MADYEVPQFRTAKEGRHSHSIGTFLGLKATIITRPGVGAGVVADISLGPAPTNPPYRTLHGSTVHEVFADCKSLLKEEVRAGLHPSALEDEWAAAEHRLWVVQPKLGEDYNDDE